MAKQRPQQFRLLTLREILILQDRLRNMTYRKIAAKHKLSPSRIYQIHKKTMALLES